MKRMLVLMLLLGVTGPGPGKAEELTVATFNIRFASPGDLGKRSWPERGGLVVETIRKMDPDLFGVQEALASQMDDLAKALPEYESYGVGRDDGARTGEYSAIFFRKARLARSEEGGTFWLSDTPEVAGSKHWGNQVVRICTWARLLDKRTGKGFYLFNTHWDHQNQASREKAGRLIARRIDQRERRDEPVILTGDFNATESNAGVAYLLGQRVALAEGEKPEQWTRALRSTFLELHPEVENRRTFNSWRDAREGPHMIDHVLVSPQWKTRKAWIEYHQREDMVPSDHWPVAAVLELAE